MAKKKSVGVTALGAAAAVATGVVVGTVAGAIMKGGKELGEATPGLAMGAADIVSKPMPKKRAAAKRSAKKAKRKVAAVKAAKTKRTAKPRKKR